jgi:hypothetical protein
MKRIYFITLLCFTALVSFAQRDTAKKQSIDITSSYKPVLRNAVKINFSASQLNPDSSKAISPYSIPQQNLFYTYQPVSLKPLALQQDTTLDLGLRNFLKAGIGNYSTPYFGAGFSFGDGKKQLVNIYADYISSKGDIKNQEYSDFHLKAAGSFFTEKNEIYGGGDVRQQDFSLYGYDHVAHEYSKEDVLQRFQAVKMNIGIRNKDKNESGINYDPNAEIRIFNNKNKVQESSLIVTAPVSKTFADVFTVRVTAKADITSYKTKDLAENVSFTNNIFSVAPELIYVSPESSFKIHGGVTPAWDNSKLNVLPNIYGELKLKDQVFLIQAGLVGRLIKNSYQNLSAINPYLQSDSLQRNTKEIEFYGGIKATLGDHFNFNAKASYLSYTNLPFFVNNKTNQELFYVSNESSVKNLRIHGDLSYISQDKFTATAGITFNGYTGMKDNDRAWGTVPVEATASLRWWAFKQVMLKGDFMAFRGGPVLLSDNTDATLKSGTDLSAGVELMINKRFSAWLDVNNIFNNKYQRWLNYPVYGLNILGGVTFKF